MTDYTDLKARLGGAAHDERLSTGALYLDALTYIEELEQRVAAQSMGNPAGQLLAEAPASQAVGASGPVGLPARYVSIPSGEPPAQSSATEAQRRIREWLYEISPAADDCPVYVSGSSTPLTIGDLRALASSAAPAPAAEPVAWALLEDLNLVQLERMAVEKEASDEQRIPCFISVEWVQRAVAAWRNAAPQPAQADEAREIIADLVAIARGKTIPEYDWMKLERADAYLARTGGKEET